MRKMMKTQLFKTILLMTAVIGIIGLTACTQKEKTAPAEPEGKQLQIVAAIFPAYDWTRNILGDNPADAELKLLLSNGVDLHSYQPAVSDILTISTADLFIYVGGESDGWVSDALKRAANPNIKVIRMLECIGDAAKNEETVEGMQTDEESGEDAELDEHVWLSLRNAAVIVDTITAEISGLDPKNAALYQSNADTYKEKLKTLDDAYTQAISSAEYRTLLFGDRFPFRYLTEDYGLDYFAAFSGCSAETEASFETITFLAQKCDELGLPAVLTIDGTDHKIAETIIRNTQNTGIRMLVLDSMQSVTAKDIEAGVTYLSIMENDLDVLKQALEVR